MVLSKEEFKEKLKTVIGDRTDDEALSIIEDFTDTYEDLESKTVSVEEDGENWKEKYEALDEEWRKKYRDRFFSGDVEEEVDTVEEKEIIEEEKKEDVEDILEKLF